MSDEQWKPRLGERVAVTSCPCGKQHPGTFENFVGGDRPYRVRLDEFGAQRIGFALSELAPVRNETGE